MYKKELFDKLYEKVEILNSIGEIVLNISINENNIAITTIDKYNYKYLKSYTYYEGFNELLSNGIIVL